jgi:hypothetical protein
MLSSSLSAAWPAHLSVAMLSLSLQILFIFHFSRSLPLSRRRMRCAPFRYVIHHDQMSSCRFGQLAPPALDIWRLCAVMIIDAFLQLEVWI